MKKYKYTKNCHTSVTLIITKDGKKSEYDAILNFGEIIELPEDNGWVKTQVKLGNLIEAEKDPVIVVPPVAIIVAEIPEEETEDKKKPNSSK